MVANSRSSTPASELLLMAALLSMPQRYAGCSHGGLCLRDGVVAKMEDRSGQDGCGMPFDHALHQMLQLPHAARGDHGDRDGIGNSPCQRQVKTGARAVPVHGGQEN